MALEDTCVDILEDDFEHDQDINWSKLHKGKFFGFGTVLFFGVRATVFPAALVKTRLQVARRAKGRKIRYGGTFDAFRIIYRTEGIRGFYAGFPTSAMGVIPAQVLYLSVYEIARQEAKTRFPDSKHEFYRNLFAGAAASFVSQFVIVPVDVVAQRLMVQGPEGKKDFPHGLAVLRHVIKTHGIGGLYRGFFSSLATYAPSSGIWWATYGSVRQRIRNMVREEDRVRYNAPIQAFAGVCAGVSASIATNPLDVIKTRIQVSEAKRLTVRQAFTDLVRQEGLLGLTNGLTAKIMNSAPVSILMISVYELVKRLSVIQ